MAFWIRAAGVLAIGAAAMPAQARDFTCRNEQAEISCDAKACEVTPTPTPMSLSRTGSTISICAYTGCAKGPILVRRTREGIDLLYGRVRWKQADDSLDPAEPLSIIYDGRSRTAVMAWRSYRQPLSCG